MQFLFLCPHYFCPLCFVLSKWSARLLGLKLCYVKIHMLSNDGWKISRDSFRLLNSIKYKPLVILIYIVPIDRPIVITFRGFF